MLLDYSSQHADEVWVKYGEPDEEWSKFKLEKRRIIVTTLPTGQKHSGLLPVKQTKVNDIRKLVDKYVPSQYVSFYDSITGNEEISSETEESEGD